jgi:hypothetical protein
MAAAGGVTSILSILAGAFTKKKTPTPAAPPQYFPLQPQQQATLGPLVSQLPSVMVPSAPGTYAAAPLAQAVPTWALAVGGVTALLAVGYLAFGGPARRKAR